MEQAFYAAVAQHLEPVKHARGAAAAHGGDLRGWVLSFAGGLRASQARPLPACLRDAITLGYPGSQFGPLQLDGSSWQDTSVAAPQPSCCDIQLVWHHSRRPREFIGVEFEWRWCPGDGLGETGAGFDGVAAEEGGGGEAFAAFELDFSEFECAGAAGDEEFALAVEHGAGGGATGDFGMGEGAEDFELGAFEMGVGTGPGVVGADGAGDPGGRQGPVDAAVGAGEFADVGGEGGVLRGAGGGAGGEEVEGVFEGGGGEEGEAVVEGGAGFGIGDGGAGDVEDVAGVEAFIHEHDGDAGLGVALADGGLDGGGAAVAGEDGGVDVEATEAGDIKHGAGEELAVGDDDGDIGGEGAEFGDGVADFGGLEDGDAALQGEELGGWGGEDHLAPGGFVGLGDDGDDLVLGGVEEPVEGGEADVAGADEEDAHGRGEAGSDFHGFDGLPFGEGDDFAEDVMEDAGGGLAGVDFGDEGGGVVLEDGFGLGLVGGEAFLDDGVAGVVEAVVFEGAFAEAAGEFGAVGAGEVEDLEDLDVLLHVAGLLDVAGDAIEDEEVDLGFELVGFDTVFDVGLPELDGEVIGYELAAAGVFDEFLAEGGAGVEGAEDIAAGEVVEAGDAAEDDALGAFAAAGGAEDEEGTEA